MGRVFSAVQSFTLAAAILILAALLGVAWAWRLRPDLPRPERGRRLAERSGCFACHGPEAVKGSPDLGNPDPVPSFSGGVLMMDTPKGAPQIREWILEGTEGMERKEAAAARADSASRAARGLPPRAPETNRGVLAMPSFRGRFGSGDLDALVSFVLAEASWGVDSAPAAVRLGDETARKAGCYGCHGPLGLFARRNPRSVKGYIPSWRGRDALELVRNHEEFRAWIHEGRPERLARNAIARWFLRRENVRMPAFHDRLTDSQVAGLDSLFFWLRSGRPDY